MPEHDSTLLPWSVYRADERFQRLDTDHQITGLNRWLATTRDLAGAGQLDGYDPTAVSEFADRERARIEEEKTMTEGAGDFAKKAGRNLRGMVTGALATFGEIYGALQGAGEIQVEDAKMRGPVSGMMTKKIYETTRSLGLPPYTEEGQAAVDGLRKAHDEVNRSLKSIDPPPTEAIQQLRDARDVVAGLLPPGSPLFKRLREIAEETERRFGARPGLDRQRGKKLMLDEARLVKEEFRNDESPANRAAPVFQVEKEISDYIRTQAFHEQPGDVVERLKQFDRQLLAVTSHFFQATDAERAEFAGQPERSLLSPENIHAILAFEKTKDPAMLKAVMGTATRSLESRDTEQRRAAIKQNLPGGVVGDLAAEAIEYGSDPVEFASTAVSALTGTLLVKETLGALGALRAGKKGLAAYQAAKGGAFLLGGAQFERMQEELQAIIENPLSTEEEIKAAGDEGFALAIALQITLGGGIKLSQVAANAHAKARAEAEALTVSEGTIDPETGATTTTTTNDPATATATPEIARNPDDRPDGRGQAPGAVPGIDRPDRGQPSTDPGRDRVLAEDPGRAVQNDADLAQLRVNLAASEIAIEPGSRESIQREIDALTVQGLDLPSAESFIAQTLEQADRARSAVESGRRQAAPPVISREERTAADAATAAARRQQLLDDTGAEIDGIQAERAAFQERLANLPETLTPFQLANLETQTKAALEADPQAQLDAARLLELADAERTIYINAAENLSPAALSAVSELDPFDSAVNAELDFRARSEANQQALEEFQEDTITLNEAIQSIGGLRSIGAAKARGENLTGELATAQKDNFQAKLFRKDGKDLDAAAEALREQGFDFETGADILAALDEQKRSGIDKRAVPGATSQRFGPGAASILEGKQRGFQRQLEREVAAGKLDARVAAGVSRHFPITNLGTLRDANELLNDAMQRHGGDIVAVVSEVRDLIDERNLGYPDLVMIGSAMIKRLRLNVQEAQKAGDTKRKLEIFKLQRFLADDLARLGTELGQGVQAFAAYAYMTPEGLLLKFRDDANKGARQNRRKKGAKASLAAIGGNAAAGTKLGKTRKIKDPLAAVDKLVDSLAALTSDTPSQSETEQRKKRQSDLTKWLTKVRVFASGGIQERVDLEGDVIKLGIPGVKADQLLRVVDDARRKAQSGKRTTQAIAETEQNQKVFRDLTDALAAEFSDTLAAIPPAAKPREPSARQQLLADVKAYARGFEGLTEPDFRERARLLGLTAKERAQLWRAATTASKSSLVFEDQQASRLDPAPVQEFHKRLAQAQALVGTEARVEVQHEELGSYQVPATPLADIVRGHFSRTDFAKAVPLADKFTQLGGLDVGPAQALAKDAEVAFAQVAPGIHRELAKQFTSYWNNNPDAKNLYDEAVKLAIAGQMSEDVFQALTESTMPLPELSAELSEKLLNMINDAQAAPEGSFMQAEMQVDIAATLVRAEGVPIMDAVAAYWYADVLSGLGTTGVNIYGNTTQLLSQLYQMVMVSVAEGNPGAIGNLVRGLGIGALNARHDVRAALTGKPIIKQANKYHQASMLAHLSKGNPLRLGDWVFRIGLQSMDAAFWRTSEEARAHWLAARLARQELKGGLINRAELRHQIASHLFRTDEQIDRARSQATAEVSRFRARRQQSISGTNFDRSVERRTLEIINQERPREIRVAAATHASRTTYTNPPEGSMGVLATYAQKMVNDFTINIDSLSRKQGKVGKMKPLTPIIPFIPIIANTVSRKFDWMPGYGLVKGFYPNRDEAGKLRFSGRRNIVDGVEFETEYERREMLVAGFTSIGVFVGGLILAADMYLGGDDGWIKFHGMGPKDFKKKNQLRKEGWRPNSIQVGDRYLVAGPTPFGILVAAVGSIHDAIRYRKIKPGDSAFVQMTTAFSAIVGGISGSFLQENFLAGVAGAFDALDGRRDPITLARNTATGLIPFSALLKDIATFMDPTVKKSENQLAALFQNVPVIKGFLGEPDLNVFGEPVITARDPISRRLLSPATSDPVWKFLHSKGIFPASPAETIAFRVPAATKAEEAAVARVMAARSQDFAAAEAGVMSTQKARAVLIARGQLLKRLLTRRLAGPGYRDLPWNVLESDLRNLERVADGYAKRKVVLNDEWANAYLQRQLESLSTVKQPTKK